MTSSKDPLDLITSVTDKKPSASGSSGEEEADALEPAAKDLEEAVTAYLRRATETFDLSKNVEVRILILLPLPP